MEPVSQEEASKCNDVREIKGSNVNIIVESHDSTFVNLI